MNYLDTAVSAPCPKSQYKDDRHSWCNVMIEEFGYPVLGNSHYYLKKCYACGLSVLAQVPPRGDCDYDKAPKRVDRIVHVFYHQEM